MTRSLQGKLGTGLLLSLITAFILLWVFVSISIRGSARRRLRWPPTLPFLCSQTPRCNG